MNSDLAFSTGSEWGSTCSALALGGILCCIYLYCMIRSLYRGDIIGYDLTAVQISYTPLSTIVKSYIGTGLESYIQSTGVESYIVLVETGRIHWVIAIATTSFGLLGTVSADGKNRRIDEFAKESGENEANKSASEESSTHSDTDAENDQGSGPLAHAYGYARQSQDDPDDDDDSDGSDESTSIQRQKMNIHETGDEHDLRVAEIFVDVNESGFSFDRPGYNDLREQLEKDPAPVILDRVNRFGRDTLETIFVAGQIHYRYEIPVITSVYGEYELSTTSDQIQLVVKAIAAGESVRDRIRAAWGSIYNLFEIDRRWYTWFDKVPVGYLIPEGEDWPKPHPDGRQVVSAIMAEVCETGVYATTLENLRKSANNQSLERNSDKKYQLGSVDGRKIKSVFEASDYDLDEFGTTQLKDLLTNTAYIGEVRYPKHADEDEQDVIEEDNLAIVDEIVFENANAMVEQIHAKHSTPDDRVDISSLSEMGILLKAVDVVENLAPICTECNRGMVKNGGKTLPDGTKVHNWICPKYNDEDKSADEQRKVPYKTEWDALRKHIEEEYVNSDVILLEICRFD